jgi:hypothetical protein
MIDRVVLAYHDGVTARARTRPSSPRIAVVDRGVVTKRQ